LVILGFLSSSEALGWLPVDTVLFHSWTQAMHKASSLSRYKEDKEDRKGGSLLSLKNYPRVVWDQCEGLA
jgi:hypothetical protein